MRRSPAERVNYPLFAEISLANQLRSRRRMPELPHQTICASKYASTLTFLRDETDSEHLVDYNSNVTFVDVEGWGNGERQWMSLHYTVNNATGGHLCT